MTIVLNVIANPLVVEHFCDQWTTILTHRAVETIVNTKIIIPIVMPINKVIFERLPSIKIGRDKPAIAIKGRNLLISEMVMNLPRINKATNNIKKAGSDNISIAKNCIPQGSYQGIPLNKEV